MIGEEIPVMMEDSSIGFQSEGDTHTNTNNTTNSMESDNILYPHQQQQLPQVNLGPVPTPSQKQQQRSYIHNYNSMLNQQTPLHHAPPHSYDHQHQPVIHSVPVHSVPIHNAQQNYASIHNNNTDPVDHNHNNTWDDCDDDTDMYNDGEDYGCCPRRSSDVDGGGLALNNNNNNNTMMDSTFLQRTFCMGAIDGVLTGSSITFAAAGFGMFDPTSPLSNRLLIIALIFAACGADGLCMALGHIWATYISNESNAQEMASEMDSFINNRAEVKARLVDMFLAKGMLKIDAMNVADTLEGYPDIFLAALMGDAGNMANTAATAINNHTALMMMNNGGASSQRQQQQQQRSSPYQQHHTPHHHGPHATNSYSNADEMDYHDHAADKESRIEGVFMMLAFSLFSIVAPIVHAFVPNLFSDLAAPASTSSAGSDNSSAATTATNYGDDFDFSQFYNHPSEINNGVSPTTVTVTVLSCVMLLLGVWKSKFYDSNWIVFGVETVLILFVCNVSAFFLGIIFKNALFPSSELPHTLTFVIS